MGTAAHELTAAFRTWVARLLGPDELVVPELGILNGSVRADLVIIGTELHGIEIKSERDTVRRLPDQIAAYDEVFDRCTIVTDAALLAAVEALLPDHWGIIVHRDGDFISARQSAINPRLDPLSVAALLWKQESAAIAVEAGCKASIRWKRKPEIDAEIVRLLPLNELRFRVRAAVAKRKSPTTPPEQAGAGESNWFRAFCTPCYGSGRAHSIFDTCMCEPPCEGRGVCGACNGTGLVPTREGAGMREMTLDEKEVG